MSVVPEAGIKGGRGWVGGWGWGWGAGVVGVDGVGGRKWVGVCRPSQNFGPIRIPKF